MDSRAEKENLRPDLKPQRADLVSERVGFRPEGCFENSGDMKPERALENAHLKSEG